jgi:osmoprotectant transport system substrate-binding protein
VARWLSGSRWIQVCALAGVGTLAAACNPAPGPQPPANVLGDRTVTVASFDFPESRLLGEIYGVALEQGGLDVRFALDLGPREFVDPALTRGLVELVPEYAGTALEFLSLGETHPSADVATTHAALARTLRRGKLAALDPAPAQTANAIVVTRETATRYGLRTISDLAAVAPRLTFGGPPECPTRPFCLAGLRKTYGLEFDTFLPLDTGGPLTVQALEESDVDVALLFTTDPRMMADDLVALTDDRALQPAENVTPFVHREVIDRFGPELVDLVDAVSARLTTDELRTLNRRVARGEPSIEVARGWVEARDLA